jgi:hypothetical protein
MTISELGSLGEFISSIAVLITLVYLAVQVRHLREERKAAAAAEMEFRERAFSEKNYAIATSPSLAEAWTKATLAFSAENDSFSKELMDNGLSEVEAMQIMRVLSSDLTMFMVQHDLLLSDEQRSFHDRQLYRTYSKGIGAAHWKNWKERGAKDRRNANFINYVDNLIKGVDCEDA